MKTNKLILLLIITITSARLTFAQSTTAGNIFGGTKYLGWTTANDLPFKIAGSTVMTLKANGFLGINTNSPQQLLHIHDGLGGSYTQYTNITTGLTNGFLIGIASDGTTDLLQRFNKPIRFYTSPAVGSPVISMLIQPDGKVGIGTTAPSSILHVSGDIANTGEVFRTTSPVAKTAAWRMLTGTGATAEKFTIYNPANSKDVVLQASQLGATMQFNVVGGFIFGAIPITRMVITDGAFSGNTGLIGMGNAFLNPQSQLHLNDGAFATYLQITNFSTNDTLLKPKATDGFKLGIDSLGRAELRQQENADMIFYTGNANTANPPVSNAERMRIVGDAVATQGFVGINTATPANRVEIKSAIIDPTRSGLRFTNLTATMPVDSVANSSGTLLSVNNTGDVILVNGTIAMELLQQTITAMQQELQTLKTKIAAMEKICCSQKLIVQKINFNN